MAKPLEGLRITDFTIHAAGPFATHLLTQLGAECIKIETSLRPDIFRKPHTVYGRQQPATYDQVASGKLSVRLNLKHPEGRKIALDLVQHSDVVAESFRPGVMKRLGLAYEDIKGVRADIVMLSVSSSGEYGPETDFAGYAPLFGAWGGLGTLTGHPDGPPVEIRHIMDHSVGLNAATATLAALVRRRRFGIGAHVDVAAREVSASLVGQTFVEAASGHESRRPGNASLDMAPSGVYPARGDDAWVAIAVSSDSMWADLTNIVSEPLPRGMTPYSSLEERFNHHAVVDEWLSRWTLQRSAAKTVQLLQERAIAAHVVSTTADVVRDEHLRSRGAIVTVQEPSGRERAAVGMPFQISGHETGIWRGTPVLGEDEEYVFGELLGLSNTERKRLEEEGAIL